MPSRQAGVAEHRPALEHARAHVLQGFGLGASFWLAAVLLLRGGGGEAEFCGAAWHFLALLAARD